MERVYRFLGLDMAPALPGMEDYMRRASALKRRPHAYSLDEFGLTSGDVLDRLRREDREGFVRRAAHSLTREPHVLELGS